MKITKSVIFKVITNIVLVGLIIVYTSITEARIKLLEKEVTFLYEAQITIVTDLNSTSNSLQGFARNQLQIAKLYQVEHKRTNDLENTLYYILQGE